MNTEATHVSRIDEDARRRFEAAWQSGERVLLETFLPPPDSAAYEPTLEELVHVDLEFSWRRPAPEDNDYATVAGGAYVEHYIARFPCLDRPTVIARLLRQEFSVRRKYGSQPSVSEYQKRFPGHQAVFDSFVPPTIAPSLVKFTDNLPDVPGFEVVGVLGRGGMGVVYEARQPDLGRVVALKTVVRAGVDERFFAEARIAATLAHPGVVPVHALAELPGRQPYYTMTLIRGETLEDAIVAYHSDHKAAGEKAVARRRLLEAFLAITRTMAFAHDKGVIHRDLKPANVVLGGFGETVILDWGLAKYLRQAEQPVPDVSAAPPASGSDSATPQPAMTEMGSVLGTPGYMPPEQAAGRINEVDERSDVYALGAILYHILTGRPPFTGSSVSELLRRAQEEEPTRPRLLDTGIPRSLEAVCHKAMEKSPGDRYSGAAALASDVERYLAGEPVSVYREGVPARVARWARRRRTLVTSAVVAVVLATVGSVAALFFWQEAEFDRQQARDREARQERENRHAHERQAREFQQEQERKRLERRAELANATEADLKLAVGQAHAGQFAGAEQILHKAVGRLRGEPGLADLQHRAEASRGRLARVAQFYKALDRAELLAFQVSDMSFSSADEDILRWSEVALREVGAGPGSGDWWTRLPDDELLATQRERLRSDVVVGIGLYSLWRLKRSFTNFSPLALAGLDRTVPEGYRAARESIGRIRAYYHSRGRRCASAELFDVFCQWKLGDRPPPPAPVPYDQLDATDAYFLGATHYFLGDRIVTTLARNVLKVIPPDYIRACGLNLDEPVPTALRLFRAATALDPGHYWAHAWLGLTHSLAGDYAASEQSFNTCVGLRPDHVVGYLGRAQSQLAEGNRLRVLARHTGNAIGEKSTDSSSVALALLTPLYNPGPSLATLSFEQWSAEVIQQRREVYSRAEQGLNEGLDRLPDEGGLHWQKALIQSWLRNDLTWRRSAMVAAELEACRRQTPSFDSFGLTNLSASMKASLAAVAAREPANADTQALLALIHLAGNETSDASAAAVRALAANPTHPASLAVRGILRLRKGETADALVDFNAVTGMAPGATLAALGCALTHEARQDWAAAHTAYEALFRLAVPGGNDLVTPGWLALECHLGRARSLARLGLKADAQLALDDAHLISRTAAEKLKQTLWPTGP